MAALLLIPFFLLRFGLPMLLDKRALLRAAHFPPEFQEKRIIYWIYQLSTAGILLYPFFLTVHLQPAPLFCAGAVVYGLGIFLLAGAVSAFASPSEDALRQRGVYRLSRNPMYVAYFLVFLGCAMLTRSVGLFGLVLCFQAAGHALVCAEERWCAEQFGEAYLQYMKNVRRYL